MDPITNLKEQRELAARLMDIDDHMSAEQAEDVAFNAARLAELVIALDEWMKKGGSSPWNPRGL